MSDVHSKDVTLTLSLDADSGCQSSESARVSADQWERILKIVYEKEDE